MGIAQELKLKRNELAKRLEELSKLQAEIREQISLSTQSLPFTSQATSQHQPSRAIQAEPQGFQMGSKRRWEA